MTLSAILKILESAENGAELKQWLNTHLSDKDTAIAEQRGEAEKVVKQLRSLGKILGVAPEAVEEKLKEVAGVAATVATLKSSEENLKQKLTEAEKRAAKVEHLANLREFSATVGANFEVLAELLPTDLTFKVDTKDEVRQGFITVEGKDVLFADFVEGDEKLRKYRGSIFTTKENPPKTPTKLPTGKGADTQGTVAKATAALIDEKRRRRAEKVAAKFSTQ